MKDGYVVRGLDVIGTESFYTGKSGVDFVEHSILSAFHYETLQGARRKASVLNSMNTGWMFMVVGRYDDRMVPVGTYEQYSGTPWPNLPHLTVQVDTETNNRLLARGEETAAKFPTRRKSK